MTSKRYLKPGLKIEPLVNSWYAWSHLISPTTLVMNVARRHIPLMRSFVANPKLHSNAMKNPAMFGGFFMEIDDGEVSSVKTLLEKTVKANAPLQALSDALLNVDREIKQQAVGGALDEIYDTLPEVLAGCTEVSYDLSNRVGIRVFERLLSRSIARLDRGQMLSFSQVRDDERAFFLNTPRLMRPDVLQIPVDFADEELDVLFRARTEGVELQAIVDALRLDAFQAGLLTDYLTDEAPPPPPPLPVGDSVRLRYFGHACVLIESASTTILVDPFVTWDHYESIDNFTFSDLPAKINAVFITHAHQDHLSVELLLQIRSRVEIVYVAAGNPNNLADPSLVFVLERLGFRNVRSLEPLEQAVVGEALITSLPFLGEHADLSIFGKQGLHVSLLGRSVALLADSDAKDARMYEIIADVLGAPDVLMIGMECHGAPLSWLYAPYMSQPLTRSQDEARRLSGSNAAAAHRVVRALSPKQTYVYALGQEPWMRFVAGLEYEDDAVQLTESSSFVETCRSAGLRCERLFGSKIIDL